MSRAICLYMHVHQPYRVKDYSIFNVANDHNYFNCDKPNTDTNNKFIIDKVSEKSYLPTNQKLLQLLREHDDFKLSLSISGTLIDQLEEWRPDVLDTFKEIVATGKVELVAETYNHSLAFFYNRDEFNEQVRMHRHKIEEVFGQYPKSFRNTELSYNNELGKWADEQGFTAIITEGWEPVLGWRSPNFVYRPLGAEKTKLLLKNYKLSDDIAFRFSNRAWEEWPLTSEKFVHWVDQIPHDQPIINLFMDYETFGEHQWEDSGIFDFLGAMPNAFLSSGDDRTFMTLSEAAENFEATDEVDIHNTITWADTERDLTAWLGNAMQQQAIEEIYSLQARVLGTHDLTLINDWRRLQTSDHFYYMCTKWFSDGDVHAYFSPYSSPYEAFISYMNVLHDLKYRLAEKEHSL